MKTEPFTQDPPLTPSEALKAIYDELDIPEWANDTIEEVARILERAGFIFTDFDQE